MLNPTQPSRITRHEEALISSDEMFGMGVHTPAQEFGIGDTIDSIDSKIDDVTQAWLNDEAAEIEEMDRLARDGFLRCA